MSPRSESPQRIRRSPERGRKREFAEFHGYRVDVDPINTVLHDITARSLNLSGCWGWISQSAELPVQSRLGPLPRSENGRIRRPGRGS